MPAKRIAVAVGTFLMRAVAASLMGIMPLIPLAAANADDSAPGGVASVKGVAVKVDGQPSVKWRGCAKADAKGKVNLSSQFIDQGRDQREIGSCHAFAAVALLEAALSRQGRQVNLSETNLFVDHVAARRAYFQILDGTFRNESLDKEGKVTVAYDEGEHVEIDLARAFKEGVASAEDFDEKGAYNEYLDWRKAATEHKQEHTLSEAETPAVLAPEITEGMSPEDKALIEEWQAEEKDVTKRDIAAKAKSFKEFIRLKFYGGPKAVEQVDESKKASAGLIGKLKPGHRNTKSKKDAVKAIVDNLCAGRPVAVNMETAGMPGFASKAEDHGRHAFIILGFTANKDGSREFQTRNSWGDDAHHQVKESLLKDGTISDVDTVCDLSDTAANWCDGNSNSVDLTSEKDDSLNKAAAAHLARFGKTGDKGLSQFKSEVSAWGAKEPEGISDDRMVGSSDREGYLPLEDNMPQYRGASLGQENDAMAIQNPSRDENILRRIRGNLDSPGAMVATGRKGKGGEKNVPEEPLTNTEKLIEAELEAGRKPRIVDYAALTIQAPPPGTGRKILTKFASGPLAEMASSENADDSQDMENLEKTMRQEIERRRQ